VTGERFPASGKQDSKQSQTGQQGCQGGVASSWRVETAESIKVEDAALDPGEIVEGLREQVKPVGAVQASEI
jgi:hypothetical protein